MAKIAKYNQSGKAEGTIEISDAVFAVAGKSSVVHQVYTAMLANKREPWAHTKDKSEVRGGGRKPWRQKGTGRARHGSNRSPIWTGGGITFGPLNRRNYKQKINKKMNRLAVRMCLSDKVAEEKLLIVDAFGNDAKTKSLADLRKALPGYGKKTVVVTAAKNEDLLRAADNISNIDIVRAEDLNVVDLMHHQYAIVSADAVAILEKRLA